ncbi:MAG: histidine--tRNA ligase [Endomicrobium sp.]|jgi:histidyl-tRNA synthetase|nr:histidine--tRNA ligase [Endomicrobium sp.]
MSFKAPRGTRDIFARDAQDFSILERAASEIFRNRAFIEVRTPIFEDAGLFLRSIGQETDIVSKEMYLFEDKKGRKLALRPEGTAGIVRAFIENRFDLSFPEGKFFYGGQMFRYERPQAGRYRQFNQIGAEYFGNASPAADAEMIITAFEILETAGIKDLKIHINSLGCQNCRPLFRSELIKYFSSKTDLCSDCVNRLEKNPLRLLDCKIDSSKFSGVPAMSAFWCPDCRENFETLKGLLSSCGLSFETDDKLVRGLDYYTKTVFEIRSGQDTLAGGGRYDNLVKELGGQNTAAVGFAFGTERVISAARNSGSLNSFAQKEKVFIAIADEELFKEAFAFSIKYSKTGGVCVSGPVNGKSLTSQLKFADKIAADKTVIFAKTEFEQGKIIIKDMKNKTQSEQQLQNII